MVYLGFRTKCIGLKLNKLKCASCIQFINLSIQTLHFIFRKTCFRTWIIPPADINSKILKLFQQWQIVQNLTFNSVVLTLFSHAIFWAYGYTHFSSSVAFFKKKSNNEYYELLILNLWLETSILRNPSLW